MATDQSSLPFLPGYRIQTIPKDRHHKTQMFEVRNGVRADINRDGNLLDQRSFPLSATHPLAITQLPAESKERALEAKGAAETTTSRLPAWVAYDRKVLRFFGYFKEDVHSSQKETWRVRRVIFYYYLEDDSLHIAEPRQENSGIPQGVLIKRHRIPKADNRYIGIDDLAIGAELQIYGRSFFIVDCDEATRAFYTKAGKELGPPSEYPSDTFDQTVTAGLNAYNKEKTIHREYLATQFGKVSGAEVAATKKFLKNDGKVLRFYCQWDDKKMFGEKRPYVMHFFLADDTVEVLEVQQQNSGRDPFSNLLKRSRLPKDNLNNLDVSRIGQAQDKKVRWYSDADFRIGETIMVYGRPLLICGCDPFTQQYYMDNYDMKAEDFTPINMEEEEPPVTELEPPPHNGFGSEEDSLGSYLHLMPKVPKPDFKKLMENEGISIRFMAQFVDPSPLDKTRRFIITFFLATDLMTVFEKFERNSGFGAGKFLERTRLKNPATGQYFKAADFVIGAVLTINRFKFKLLDADTYTRRYVTAHPEIFGEEAVELIKALPGEAAFGASGEVQGGTSSIGAAMGPQSAAPLPGETVLQRLEREEKERFARESGLTLDVIERKEAEAAERRARLLAERQAQAKRSYVPKAARAAGTLSALAVAGSDIAKASGVSLEAALRTGGALQGGALQNAVSPTGGASQRSGGASSRRA